MEAGGLPNDGRDIPSARPGPITRRQFVLTLAISIGAVLILWDTPLLLPLQLLVTFVHEAMHALVAMALGADVSSVTINARGGGLTYFRGSLATWETVAIASAGYVGTAIVGGVFFELCSRMRSGHVVLATATAAIVAAGLAWVPLRVRPDGASAAITGSTTGDGRFTIAFCVLAVVALAGLIWQRSTSVRRLFLVVVATGLSLGAVEDLRQVFGSARRGGGSDASILQQATGLPAWLWATTWMLLGSAACALGVWSALSNDRVEPKR